MTLILKRTENDINRIERQGINNNWEKIEQNFNNVVSVISDEAFNEVVDSARLVWQEPVDTFADLTTTYPDAKVGWASWSRERVGGVNVAYRFDGTSWLPLQEFDGDAINDVETRLTAEIRENVTVIRPTGTSNDSPYLNAALQENGNYLIKAGIYNIDQDVFAPKVGTITFEKGAVFKKTPTTRDIYFVLNIFDCDDVTINNPTIIGDKDVHLGTTGEFGYGIHVSNTLNAIINNPNVSNCWGDGIYIGNTYERVLVRQSGRIIVNNPVIDNCRRQGISIGSGRHIEIHNSTITNIGGTAPGAGIDIEPEGTINLPILDYVLINNIETRNCTVGIAVHLNNISNRGLSSNIEINNHSDVGSLIGFTQYTGGENINGSIVLNKPNYSLNKANGISIDNPRVSSVQLIVNDAVIRNCNVNNFTADRFGSAISVYSDRTDEAVDAFGNVMFRNPTIIDNRSVQLMRLPLFFARGTNSNSKVVNASFIDPILSASVRKYVWCPDGIILSDRYRQLVFESSYFSQDLNNQSIATYRNNIDATGNVTYNLTSLPENIEVTIEIVTRRTVIISPGPNQQIVPLTSAIGKNILSFEVGNSVTLKRRGTNWFLTNIVGDWTEQT